jgi:hypothetical protein
MKNRHIRAIIVAGICIPVVLFLFEHSVHPALILVWYAAVVLTAGISSPNDWGK